MLAIALSAATSGTPGAPPAGPAVSPARARLLGHLPSTTVTMVLVDLAAIAASHGEEDRAWGDVALRQISERFLFEQHRLDLARDVGAFVFFELWDGARYGRGYLLAAREGLRPLVPGTGVRDFDDGTWAIAEPWVLDALPQQGSPAHMASLLARLDPEAAVLGATRRRITLTVSHGNLDPAQVPLPGIAFALQVGLGASVQISGKVITEGPATEEVGRTFLATLADFLRPEGSFAPGGAALAASAQVTATGDTVTLRLTLPRQALVAEEEPDSPFAMREARGGHVMAALPDGRVVVAGGFDGQRGLASLEMLEPAQRSSRLLPFPLVERRAAAGAALSGAAKLYLFHGMQAVGEGMEPPSAEVVDLALGTSTPLPRPPGPGRVGPTATLLRDGRILVAGGAIRTELRDVPDAYLFETRGATFTPVAGSMAVPRGDHAAVLLEDGRVLFAGGVTSRHEGPPTDTLEIFDPATERFRPCEARLPSPRTGLAGARLGDGRAALLGGFHGERALDQVVVFDARSDTVTLAGRMQASRYYFAAVSLPDGRVLVSGGGMGNLAMRDSIELWPVEPR